MHARLYLSVALSLGIVGLAVTSAHAEVAGGTSAPDDEAMVGGSTGYVLQPPERFTAAGDPISKIIYLNRCVGDCRVQKSDHSDARTDLSSIPVGADGETFTIREFIHGDAVWANLMACVADVYGPYNVTVTDVDPGPSVLHHEAIVAGVDADINRDGILGIAPMAGDCSPQNNVISFTFANDFANVDQVTRLNELCATVAQESAHAFGLDHAFDCTDPMTYLEGCGKKFFRNKVSECGEFAARPCACAGRQNSHLKLTTVFGAGTQPPAPTLELQLPTANATVTSGFDIALAASDERGVSRVELYFNGWKWDEQVGRKVTDSSDGYFFAAPGELPDGVIDVEVRAYNDLESVSTQSVRVTKGAPCATADSCLDGQTCDGDGRCVYPTPVAELGDACVRNQECTTLLCATDGTDRLCTQTCFTGVNDTCPDGFSCLDDGTHMNTGVCWPEVPEEGGCCSVASSSSGAGRTVLTQIFLGAMVALLLTRRRRR